MVIGSPLAPQSQSRTDRTVVSASSARSRSRRSSSIAGADGLEIVGSSGVSHVFLLCQLGRVFIGQRARWGIVLKVSFWRQEPDPAPVDRPLVPLAAALPRMLEKIETELGNEKIKSAEKWHLYRRAELIRELLAPRLII
jgi:hypothetical protein